VVWPGASLLIPARLLLSLLTTLAFSPPLPVSFSVTNDIPWYSEGLRFECQRSGNCCSGGPGVVRVTDEDIAALARYIRLAECEFRKIYTRLVGDQDVSLRDKSNHDCIFYDRSEGCTVYDHRPRQCRTWPFWRHVVSSPERWADEATKCPGMNRGPLRSCDYIRENSEDDGTFGGRED